MSQDKGPSPAAQRLLELITSSWVSQATYVAAELRLADLLANGPKTSRELAALTHTDAPALHRLLRALTTLDICHERDDGSFAITAMGSLLAADSASSLRSWTIWWGQYQWPIWGNLLYSIKTGQSARTMLSGTKGFEHLERDPQAAATFNQALVELTRLSAASVVHAYSFSGLKRIMDVGGGYGELLSAILAANPSASGVLFDLPHAIEGARRHFEEKRLTGRCAFISGDFFKSIPGGADAYILKSVIHDWNDERSRQILESCRKAMGPGARLLLVERVVPDRLGTSPDHQSIARSDLHMLVALAAKERTETEFRDLLQSSGFRVSRVIPAGMTHSIIEAFTAA